MFYYIEGKVAEVLQGMVVIDCGGVGYVCYTSRNTISAITARESTRLYTYLYVREDTFDLYGFADQEERNCFKLLINVSGVGPKAALAILSSAPPSSLALGIITGDEKLLMQAPGIGKKIAQRIILELRDKMAKEQLENGQTTKIKVSGKADTAVSHTQEAIAALLVLGYSQSEAVEAMAGLQCDDMKTEEIIKYCLKQLSLQ